MKTGSLLLHDVLGKKPTCFRKLVSETCLMLTWILKSTCTDFIFSEIVGISRKMLFLLTIDWHLIFHKLYGRALTWMFLFRFSFSLLIKPFFTGLFFNFQVFTWYDLHHKLCPTSVHYLWKILVHLSGGKISSHVHCYYALLKI